MRLIGSLDDPQKVYTFCTYLSNKGIEHSVDTQAEGTDHPIFAIWIQHEEDFENSFSDLELFKQNPLEPRFQTISIKPSAPKISSPPPLAAPVIKPGKMAFFTNLFLAVCIAFFIINGFQRKALAEKNPVFSELIGFTPIDKTMLFDFPKQFESLEEVLSKVAPTDPISFEKLPLDVKRQIQQIDQEPSWSGIYYQILGKKPSTAAEASFFAVKIREGELWRLFTPCVLHKDFLHIAFNLLWIWLLAKQIEVRIGARKLFLLCLVIGVISNIAQYIISGPIFLGASGIVCGLAGFIWMRQKKAPWEGYPLQKGTIVFLAIFVAAMFLLQLGSFIVQYFSIAPLELSIANTAHIIGGIVGAILGRFSLFVKARA